MLVLVYVEAIFLQNLFVRESTNLEYIKGAAGVVRGYRLKDTSRH